MLLSAAALILAVASVGEGSPPPPSPRPALPVFAHLQGRVQCFNQSVYCAGPTQCSYQAYFAFAPNNTIRFYREDSVCDNPLIPFVREFVTATDQYEYFLLNSSSSSLQCVHLSSGRSMFDRNFLDKADFVGVELIQGRQAWTFRGTWTVFGTEQTFFAWVATDNDAILGWNSTNVRYDYFIVDSLPSFAPDLYQHPDGVVCVPPHEAPPRPARRPPPPS